MPRPRRSFPLVELALVLALACVAVVGYKLAPRLAADADLTLAPIAGCDLNDNACAAELPAGARLELSITPRPIPLVKPLQIAVRITGAVADQVEIDFAGVTMDMGDQRHKLVADGDGGYRGEAMLPVCVSGRMLWRATLRVDAGRQKIAVPFLFSAPQREVAR